MDYQLSRSEKKRRVKNIEALAVELVELSPQDINRLPCDDFLKKEILAARPLKTGARKRQIKFLAKNLRELDDSGPLFAFMEEQNGSRLKHKKEFHELENLRDTIINEAIAAAENGDADEEDARSWPSPAITAAASHFPDLDTDAVRLAAWRYTHNRSAVLGREIFRLLKAAAERQKWQDG